MKKDVTKSFCISSEAYLKKFKGVSRAALLKMAKEIEFHAALKNDKRAENGYFYEPNYMTKTYYCE